MCSPGLSSEVLTRLVKTHSLRVMTALVWSESVWCCDDCEDLTIFMEASIS